ncbi:hypothetical protein F5Y09DRAFT_338823 [Xylaria sp. FL1042]|nr:hypothetical protein F5Y09DRAFT_338823 [Xylaria sp. FL1042]
MPGDEAGESLPRLSIDSLKTEHRQFFSRALQNVLESDIAKLTYGQIINRLPLTSVERESYNGSVTSEHSIRKKHSELCSGVLERLREIHDARDIASLNFDSTLIDAYNNTTFDSCAFETLLIEMTVVAVHQITVQLCKSEMSLRENDGMGSWEPADEETMPPTSFQHEDYRDYDIHPDGLADGVAYWAETRIFGGVVLFERCTPDSSLNLHNDIGIDPNAIYLHSDECDVTCRLYQLTDKQRCDLVTFLLSETTPLAECPIPMKKTNGDNKRIDPEESHFDTSVYRDMWQGKPL